MPYIRLTTNKKILPEAVAELKRRFATDISLLPGKSDMWLMMSFDDECDMCFRGDSERPAVMISVSLFGASKRTAYDALTAALTDAASEILGAVPERIYVSYAECGTWGYAGENF